MALQNHSVGPPRVLQLNRGLLTEDPLSFELGHEGKCQHEICQWVTDEKNSGASLEAPKRPQSSTKCKVCASQSLYVLNRGDLA